MLSQVNGWAHRTGAPRQLKAHTAPHVAPRACPMCRPTAQVFPGARIPTDGVVEAGASYVDESMLTGESQPVSKSEGSPVFGGTVNVGGPLRIRASRWAGVGGLGQGGVGWSGVLSRVQAARGRREGVAVVGGRGLCAVCCCRARPAEPRTLQRCQSNPHRQRSPSLPLPPAELKGARATPLPPPQGGCRHSSLPDCAAGGVGAAQQGPHPGLC